MAAPRNPQMFLRYLMQDPDLWALQQHTDRQTLEHDASSSRKTDNCDRARLSRALGYSYFRRDEAETALIAEVEHTQSKHTAADEGEADEREPFCKRISRCTEWVKNPAPTCYSPRASEDV
jgi:hypothetical protein